MLVCYQCDKETIWLAPDSRCGDCTSYIPTEVRGEEVIKDEGPEGEEELLFD